MEQQQVTESTASLTVDVKAEKAQAEPEPQLGAAVGSPTDDASKNKKKKNRRKSLEKVEVEELKADKSEPEEEEATNQEEASIEEAAVTQESTVVEEVTVAEEATVAEETTVESTVTQQSTVAEKASIKKETVEEHHDDSNQEHEAIASDDELAPPSLERTTSLDTLKATGTKAVGSLFSRFKVGRKKPLPSRTDSAAQLELVVPSPVKTAVKKLEIPEEKSLDDLPMRTNRDFFADGEQSIHVSTEKDKYDTLEKQRKAEKEAEEAAIAARRTPPSSSRSNVEVEAQLEAAKEQIEAATTKTEDSVATEVATSSTSAVTVEEMIKPDDTDEVEPTFEASREDGTPVSLEATTEVENGTASTDTAAIDTEADPHSRDATTLEPVSLKLDLDLEPRNDVTETTKTQFEHVDAESSKPQPDDTTVEAILSTGGAPSEVVSTEKTELLSVKITPPTSELPAEAAQPAKPEKMSPVKSLASRFEGKREQSLDSLKFRTVREFFPTERSIRVGAEKQKYEAQAQQQQLKAKAEEEAKSKYKASLNSPVKEAAAPELKATESVTPATVTEAGEFSTPDAASSRKKFSFDEGYSSANSPSKFSDEALTPVKSIASRFEGKREQSLDSLKFRTVREFFPEERSVRVGSEKQKFEVQAQQENALDKLKFRTVREFFPDEGKRSIHVGAEKAKFEAITKQQEEAKAAEQLKHKHTVPPTTEKSDNSVASTIVEATIETSSSALDESQEETVTNAAELRDDVASPVENTVAVEADKSLTATSDSEAVSPVEVSAKEEERDSPPSADAKAAVVDSEDTSALSAENQVDVVKSAEPVVPVGSDGIDVSKEVKEVKDQPDEPRISIEETEIVQEEENIVGVGAGNQEEPADAGTEKPMSNEQICADIKQTENQETVNEVETTDELVKLDLEEPEPGITASSEQDHVAEPEKTQEPVEVTVGEPTTSELVELDLGGQVEENFSINLSTSESATVNAEVNDLDTQQPVEIQEEVTECQLEVEKTIPSADSGLVELDLGEPVVEAPKVHSNQGPKSKRPMLTTERSFVMEKDDTIETEDTVVVGERPMTDGEDEFEPMSPTKARPAHELFAGIPSSKSKKELKKKNSAPKLTRKVSVGSVGSSKSSSSKTTVPVPMKRASITAPTASYMAKKAAEAEEHKSSQLKKKGSASKLKGAVASPTVPIPMKRASITAPTASYMARKAAEEAHRVSPQPKQHSKQKRTVSETSFVKPAPTVPVPMKRASITAPTASWQARNIPEQFTDTIPKNHATKPTSTVPVAPKRASIMAPTASYKAKKAAETEEIDTVASAPRNKRYSSVKSKVLESIQSGSTHTVTHKKITKEEFIAAERRKSLGSAGVRSVLDAVDRRASLTARATIDGPPEPFIRSAHSRKKLNSTVPRYLDYENTPGYAERARKQYERRKRLEEENAAKSDKRQRELRVFFTERQQKSMMSSAEEVRRGLEAHEFTQLAKESELEAKKALRRDKQRTRGTRSHRRTPSTTSSTEASSNGVASRTSKKSSVSSASVEEKVVAIPAVELTVVETEEVIESTGTVELKEEIATEEQEVVTETISVSVLDDDPALEHVAKKIDFDEASSDSEKEVSNE
ncbi:hypothetical protein PI124_g4062 [Phytophthora idaei]|nr:hypothetical protein PI125_g2021 [Phytophthora idaei]KAG3168508.1 hypothetical protein PI126_g3265 [Phytophthora idaei]KAG3251328.1 hypothetical protein PI124_g4062 [Phytophthora idaei]